MMRVRRKLAAVAVAGGVLAGSVALAAPAGATVVNVGCPTNQVTVYSDGGNYCYTLVKDGNTGPGWANIPNSWAVGSGNDTGYVQADSGWIPVHFSPGSMVVPDCPSGCYWTTRWIYITNN
ncbi:hypothetical protein [Actinacidiphila acididurans]|uniref:Secreted protein n=1 Tax=Actinacidiphila acididurans TaxID=2784346 RepID=A0ABS2TLE2_9ACTN|nr:hypothetical protein [Actinacidiphila acididurans]MBM9504148.1 hypothetical protein [Actinacidiphila acididurans]